MTVPEPINLKPKSCCGPTRQSSSITISPTKSHSYCLLLLRLHCLRNNILASISNTLIRVLPRFSTRNRSASNPLQHLHLTLKFSLLVLVNRLVHRLLPVLLSLPPLLVFFHLPPLRRHRFLRSQGRLDILCSYQSQSLPYLLLPISSRVPKPFSFMSMSLANDLGRSVSGLLLPLRVYGTTTSGGPDSVVSATMGT